MPTTSTQNNENENQVNNNAQKEHETKRKLELDIVNAHMVNDSYQLTFDKNIRRYVKTNPDADTEEGKYTLEEVNNISFFTSDVIKSLINSSKLFKTIYMKANVRLSMGRKNDNTKMIDEGNQLKLDAQSYALADAKIELTFKDIPKGTLEEYTDEDGTRAQRKSLRPKRNWSITSITIGSFANELLRDLLRS